MSKDYQEIIKNNSNEKTIVSKRLNNFKEMKYKQYSRRKKAVNDNLDLIFKELQITINKVRRYEKQVNKESM